MARRKRKLRDTSMSHWIRVQARSERAADAHAPEPHADVDARARRAGIDGAHDVELRELARVGQHLAPAHPVPAGGARPSDARAERVRMRPVVVRP